MPPLDPIVSEFASTEEEAAHDTWVRAKVQASLDDPRPGIPHDQVVAHLDALITELRAERGSADYAEARLAG